MINHTSMLGLNDGARRYAKIPDMPTIPDPPPVRSESVRGDKDSEIEKIKRLLHNLIDRVDALKSS